MASFCNYYESGICRSCSLLDLEYSAQLKLKEDTLREGLKALGDVQVLPSIGSGPLHFRNKAKLTVTGSKEKPILGLWGEETLDEGREILNCPLHHPEINKLLACLPEFITLAGLIPYKISEKKGELKGLILYHSPGTHESYLRFVLRSKESLDRIKKHLRYLQERFPKLTCVSANIQPVAHAILEGDEEIILSDLPHIEHLLGEVHLQLGPKGFVQTNQSVAEKLYATAAEWTKDIAAKKFAEVFAGQGAFSFFASKHVDECVGFEIDPDAVRKANETIKKYGYPRLRFECRDAADIEKDLVAYKPDVVLANPPRRGLGESLRIFKANNFPYFIYSSCSVESLIKDLKALENEYKIVKAQIFDMFPHTKHFETLVLLVRNI